MCRRLRGKKSKEGGLTEVKLKRADLADAETIWKMQVEAFSEIFERYRDEKTNPAAESLDKTAARLKSPTTFYYFIEADGGAVGAIRVVDEKDPNKPKRISPIFIMPQHRNKGFAQKAILEAEKIHGASNWELEAILQEAASCALYKKLGYRRTGEERQIAKGMTLGTFRK